MGRNSSIVQRNAKSEMEQERTDGCQWRQLPHDFPPYATVWSFYRRACISGLWDAIRQHVVEEIRKKADRKPKPTYGIIDSQSVKTVYRREERGFDGNKKNQGS